MDCARYPFITFGEVEAVGVEIIEIIAIAEIVCDPASRRLHRDADAVVLAHEQYRRRQFLVCGPLRRVERRLCSSVIGRGIAERADGDRILWNRQLVRDALGLLDRNCRPERFGQVRGNRRGLRQHPQRLATPYLVASARGRIVLARGEAQRGIHDRVARYTIGTRQLAEALGHKRAGTVMQERRIRVPRQPRDHRIAFVAGGSNRVEHLVLDAQHARHQIQMPADQLRVEQFHKVTQCTKTARQHRCVLRGHAHWQTLPALHELDEILIANFSAIDVLVAGGDGVRNGVHDFMNLRGYLDRAISAAFSAAIGGIGTKPSCARTRASQARTAGYAAKSKPPSAAQCV